MHAFKATFDGEKIVLPESLSNLAPGKVIVVFDDLPDDADIEEWMRMQEEAFAKVWDNDEDSVYDSL